MAVLSQNVMVGCQEIPECAPCVPTVRSHPVPPAAQAAVLRCGAAHDLERHLQEQSCPAEESVSV